MQRISVFFLRNVRYALCVFCLVGLQSACGTAPPVNDNNKVHDNQQTNTNQSACDIEKQTGCAAGYMCCRTCCGIPVPEGDPRLKQVGCVKPTADRPGECPIIP
jgi:hypothetical protein